MPLPVSTLPTMHCPGSAGPRPARGRGHGGILEGVTGVALVKRTFCRLVLLLTRPWARRGTVSTMIDLEVSEPVRTFSAVIERCPDTGLLVGYVPGFPGAHSQGETLDELQANLQEVIAMLLEDGEPTLESDFVGLQQIIVPA